MTDEEIKQKFKETYPDFMRGDTPLSPYFDIWCYGIELFTEEMQQDLDKIRETCELSLECKQHDFDRKLKELETQIEKMKCFKNCLTFADFKCPAQSDQTIKSCSGCKYWKLKED